MGILDWNWSLGLMDWVLGLITVLGILYYLCIRSYNRFSKYNIPHLKPYPIVGSLGKDVTKEFPYLVQDFYNKLKEHQYGGCYFFSLPIFFITDPELIKAIAVKDFEYFTDHRSLTQRPPGKEDVFTKGLFTLKGQRWKEMRATLSPAFTSSKMKTMFVLISDCCKQLVDFLEENQHKSVPGCNISKENEMMVLELKEFFTRYTNDVIATTAFGVGVDSLKQPNNEFFVMGQDVTNIPLGDFLPWCWFLS
ncbi:Cytochrome P450 9e2 [Blattella germanica]|nr:Cytochrome P450 9e2 [Blattella germanica]